MKKVVSLFMAFVMLLSLTAGIDMSASAGTSISVSGNGGNITISNLKSDYAKKVKGFLSDARWKHGTAWASRSPKLSPFSSTGCCAYAADFAKYVYNCNTPRLKTSHKNVSQIKSGDIIWRYVSASNQHWLIVLKRNGNKLITAEGNFGTTNKKVNVSSGYYTISGSNLYQGGSNWASSTNVTVYHYNEVDDNSSTSPTVTVTFNGNGGTVSKSSLSVTKGRSMGNNIPSATRTGYTFNGWYTAKSGGTKYSTTTAINSNITLYAQWIANNKNVLKEGRIYRIYNYNSGLPLQANGSGNKALVSQREYNKTNAQLWLVSDIDNYGYYRFTNLNSRRVLDITGGYFDLGNDFQIYNDNGSKNQSFSLIQRKTVSGKKLYSIHPQTTGRAMEISGHSLTAGGQLKQYYYLDGDNQLFYFEEVTDRSVLFFDNLSNNYLPTPREEYTHSGSSTPKSCYISRNTDYVTTSINAPQNKLIINVKKAGSPGKDMTFSTTVNGSYNYDMYDSNTNKMYLGFTAKSSVQGAKIYFRWGYDSTSSCKSVTLSTTAANYLIELPRTLDSGSNIHPYVDRACTIEMTNIQLKSDPNASISFSYGDTYSSQSKTYNVNNVTYGTLPQPKTIKSGYTFDGWYTDRVGGTKVTSSTKIGCNTKLYAHWKKDTTAHTHTYGSGKVTKAATTSSAGTITYTCTKCSATKTGTIPKISTAVLSKTSYTYDGRQKNPTVTVKDINGKVLRNGTDYTLTYTSGRTNAGTYYVTVSYKGNYSGSTKLSFKVIQQIPSRCTPKLSKTSYTYDGNQKNPTVTIKDVCNNTLVKGRDYTLTYDSGRTNVGTYDVKITYIGNYSGTDTVLSLIHI